MLLDLDVGGRSVLVLGSAGAARRALRRLSAAGARVVLVAPEQLPSTEDETAVTRLLRSAWLTVTVDLDQDVGAAIHRLARSSGLLITAEEPAPDGGRVTLVGGGPGSPDLLTVAACAALRDADVVCYDRLAPRADLPRLAPGAELLYVGKTPYHHQLTQEQINGLLVERAQRGEHVVRLKGGDSFVFGRGSEELQACAAAGVAVRVVPGVSSAIAVPAAAGIPLTHRGLSHAFTVISGHVLPTVEEFAALAGLGGSIVILMGVANLTGIAGGLRAAGLADRTPAAVIERGFSDSQRTTHTTLARLADDARRLDVVSPAVVVVGEVARLGGDLDTRLPWCALDPVPRG